MRFPWTKSKFPPIARGVEVYFDKSRFLICPAVYAASQLNGPGTPYESLERSIPSASLGQAVRNALERSRIDLADSEFDMEVRQVLREANVTSIDDLATAWSLIRVEEVESGLTVSPMHRCADGGYASFQGDPVFTCLLNSSSIGTTICDAVSSMTDEMVDLGEDIGHY